MHGLSWLCCDLRLGDSRLQYLKLWLKTRGCCDLRLGDSRLQCYAYLVADHAGCDLRLGDSRLQLINFASIVAG